MQIYRQLSVEFVKWPPVILSKFIIDPTTTAKILPGVQMDDDHLIAMRGVFIKHWLMLGEDQPYLQLLLAELKKFDTE